MANGGIVAGIRLMYGQMSINWLPKCSGCCLLLLWIDDLFGRLLSSFDDDHHHPNDNGGTEFLVLVGWLLSSTYH